jgi:hypothetical protein
MPGDSSPMDEICDLYITYFWSPPVRRWIYRASPYYPGDSRQTEPNVSRLLIVDGHTWEETSKMHIIIVGQPGSGKTSLIEALGPTLREFGVECIFTTQTSLPRVHQQLAKKDIFLIEESPPCPSPQKPPTPATSAEKPGTSPSSTTST